MTSLLPRQQAVEHSPNEQTDVEIASDESVELLGAIASETAQAILARLERNPSTASDITADVETSLQNVQYHLDRLCAVNVVEPVDTWYSDCGNAMTVYGLAAEEVVIQLEATERSPGIEITGQLA